MKLATKKRNEQINRRDKLFGTYVYSCYYYAKSREEILIISKHVNQCGTGFVLGSKTLLNGRTNLVNDAEYPQHLIDAIEELED